MMQVISNSTSIAEFPAVFMPPTSTHLVAKGLAIVMQQHNVSNAFKIFGTQFELAENVVKQEGSCMWPVTPPTPPPPPAPLGIHFVC